MTVTVFFMLNYQQTLDYMFARLPMFSRIGAAAYKADLTNTIKLCETLGNPHHQFKSIHIAGTNGKGSVSHTLAAILQTAGYKTGLYTSPHLRDFRERIKINGLMIEEAFVVDFTERVKPFIELIEPSFFEITVAMAFEYFALQKVDIAIIETGLGGRLDSTNVITPELSVITNIGYDHMNILGETLPLIAAEKAGIIKHKIPVVIGETLPETLPVFEEKAALESSPIFYASKERWIADWEQQNHKLKVTVADTQSEERKLFELSLTGLYQLKNLLTVFSSIHQLQLLGWKINESNIQQGLLHVARLTGFEGRWQIIHENPYTVLDVGHNEDGVRQIVSQLEHCKYQKLHIVIGLVKDKDISKVLALLPKHAQFYFTRAQIPRALPENELMQLASPYELHGNAYRTVSAAVQSAVIQAQTNDMILICGSVFVVGEVNPAYIKW